MLSKIFLIKGLNFSIPPVMASSGLYFIYHNYGPKSIGEWLNKDGMVQIINDNHFKSVFEENKDSVSNELAVDGLDSSTSMEDAPSKIKNGCEENGKKPGDQDLKEKIIKFCVYNPKTIKGWLVGSGHNEKIITDEDDYKTLFAVLKKTASYLNKISGAKDSDSNDEGKSKVKNYCEMELKHAPTSDYDLSGIFAGCLKPGYKTVKEKLGNSWTMISEDEKWKNAFEKGKYTEKIIELIKKDNESENSSLSSSTSKDDGGPKMKNGCTNSQSKNLFDQDVYPTLYLHVKSSCVST